MSELRSIQGQPPKPADPTQDQDAVEGPEYVLHLYVAGSTPRSVRAVERVSRLCREHLEGRYVLQVIDIYQDPILAQEGQIVATPTLVRSLPEPLRHVVGDMADEGRLLMAISVRAAP
jgi:circadian clock protein KaiB